MSQTTNDAEAADPADYRGRIYENYASNFQDLDARFDEIDSRRWGRAYHRYFRGWLPRDKDAVIVDVACGGGKLLHFFKELGYRDIRGVDLSPEQVRIARQVTPDVFEENALDFLERHPGAFDLVTGLDIIEHLHKSEVMRFVELARRALKPGGRLVLQTPNADSPFAMSIRYGDFTHEVCFNANVLSRLLRISGFEAIEAREMGPQPSGGIAARIRFLVWRFLRLGLKVWNIAETGSAGSGVFTRVFAISATAPA